ncbi:MAG: ribosome maturation factor RimP [Clostridiaceae bacterium]
MEEKLNVIQEMTEQSIRELGYWLYHLEFATEEGENYLRFFIENPSGEPITLDDCEKVSRRVSVLIDEKDPIESAYFLEISSPGLFRQLYTLEHAAKAVGERVRVRLADSEKGKKNFLGILTALEGDQLVLEVEGKQERIDWNGVRLIHLEPEV